MRRIPIFWTAPAALLTLTLALAPAAAADTVILVASRDNTLYEDMAGSVSNGQGENLFAGNTLGAGVRRGLLAFNVVSNVPPGSVIEEVTLTLHVSNVPPGFTPTPIGLHRVLQPWGEGASAAGGPGGQGVPAAPGDATWLHTFYDTDFWTTPGGDFDGVPSATQMVGDVGFVTWGSTPEMVADVQEWLDFPEDSDGWLLLGDEVNLQTARRFDSRENVEPDFWPVIEVQFTPPTVVEIPTLSQWGMILLTLALLAAGARRLRRT